MVSTWKTVRIFISSTFRDMQAERDHLVRFVFPRLREDLLDHRVQVIDVDLRWGVTSEQDAVGVCREVIDECRPRFMGILGGRYGWVPEGRTESITADEIHYAVLGRPIENRGQCFFYFRDEDTTRSMVEPTPGDYREADGSINADKLAELKEAIGKASLPLFIYPARWSESQQRLTCLEAFGDRVYADLIQSFKEDPELADRFIAEADAKEPGEFDEEAEQMDAFIEERTGRFVLGSREPLMRDLLDFVAADGTPNLFVLTGPPGSGKSAFLAKLTRDLVAFQPASIILPHFIGASTGSTDLRRTLRRLCHKLAHAAGSTEPLPFDLKELIIHFRSNLAETAGRQRIILVFDALNQFDATDGAHWLNWLPRDVPPGVRIVASVIDPVEGEEEHQTLAILRNRKDARVESLKPFDESDTLAIINGYRKRYAKQLSPEQIAALQEKPASNLPLYVITALEELRTLGTYEEITDRIHALPGDARALFGWILTERLAKDPGFRDREGRTCGTALVNKLAAYLGVSRHGLSPAELTALLDPGDPLGNVAALLRLLRPYLMRRGELLDFYHGQFREAAEAAYLDLPEKLRAAHLQLADFFELQPVSSRSCDELPWQLAAASQIDRLRNCLLDIERFLKIHERDRDELIRYWVRLREERKMGALYIKSLDVWQDGQNTSSVQASIVVSTLASFLHRATLYTESETLYRRALSFFAATGSADSSQVVGCLRGLGGLLSETNRKHEAEPLLKRALAIEEESYGPEHRNVARSLIGLAQLFDSTNRPSEARSFALRALEIDEKLGSPDDPAVARDLLTVAWIVSENIFECEKYLRRALAIDEKHFGPNSSQVMPTLDHLAYLLTVSKRFEEAERLRIRSLAIAESTFGPDSRDVAAQLNNYGKLLQDLKRFSEAVPLMKRSIGILEGIPGQEDLIVTNLNNLALLMREMKQPKAAETMLRRAIQIGEQSLGFDHPDVARGLNNLSRVLFARFRFQEALTLRERVNRIYDRYFQESGQKHKRAEAARLDLKVSRFVSSCLSLFWTLAMIALIWFVIDRVF